VIPRIIHQIWLGPLTPPSKALDSWKKKHPNWEYRLWTEDNLPNLKNQHAFDVSDNYPQKADILRYELLEQFGGVYVDADVHCIKPVDRSVNLTKKMMIL
jgi:mannosyltransferase OCH1-like enzyme